MSAEEQVFNWFKQYGVVHEVQGDPRGRYWVRGYLEEITPMILDQIAKAENRGYKQALEEAKPAVQAALGRTAVKPRPRRRAKR